MITDTFLRRLFQVFGAIVLIVLLGTAGYILIEGWNFEDGLFMTVITLSTVGYGETNDLTQVGRLFTSVLILFCLFATSYWTATVTSFLVEEDLTGHYRRRRMLKMISKLKNHTIVCGSGRMAQAVIERLLAKRGSVVVVDDNKERLDQLKQRHRQLLTVHGKPTNEVILAQANVIVAGNVVAATDNEVDNLLVAITCRDLGNDVAVFARSNDTSIANRMRKAGVDEVISPSQLSGNRVAELILGQIQPELSPTTA